MRPPARNVVRIGTGNVDSGNPAPSAARRLAEATGAHSWGWQEGKNLASLLKNSNSYRPLTALGMGFEIPNDANDCIMQVRNDLDVVHFSMTKTCDAIPNSKVAHARTISILGYDVPGWSLPFYHINIHPNWVQGIRDGLILDRFLETCNYLGTLVDFVSQQTPNYAVSGDFNITIGESRQRDHTTPHKICKLYEMQGLGTRLDWIYWSDRLKLVNKHKIPKRITKSDHPYWLVGDLARK